MFKKPKLDLHSASGNRSLAQPNIARLPQIHKALFFEITLECRGFRKVMKTPKYLKCSKPYEKDMKNILLEYVRFFIKIIENATMAHI